MAEEDIAISLALGRPALFIFPFTAGGFAFLAGIRYLKATTTLGALLSMAGMTPEGREKLEHAVVLLIVAAMALTLLLTRR